MRPQSPTFLVGDVHGDYEKLLGLLRGASLIDRRLAWSGGDASLWFMGDLFDRGPDGVDVADLVMRLRLEAQVAGGSVRSLLGNHEILLLSALFFGDRPTAWGGTFTADWLRNGGWASDLDRLTDRHIKWLTNLPAMAHAAGRLLIHADALFYTRYGNTLPEVNSAIKRILQGRDPVLWDRLLADFSERRAFLKRGLDKDDPTAALLAADFLRQYGGAQIVHGHTQIRALGGTHKQEITGPLVYAGGLCMAVDGGMGEGGEGFVCELAPLDPARAASEAWRVENDA